jgi:hypothetical protein
VTREADSEKRRGRRPIFSDEELRRAAQFGYARRVRTRRGAQDLVYRKFAIAVIELYREAHPERREQLDWLLTPMPRYSLLSELGRVAEPRSSEDGSLAWSAQDVNRLIQVALEIAKARPSTKTGIAMIRGFRRQYRSAA